MTGLLGVSVSFSKYILDPEESCRDCLARKFLGKHWILKNLAETAGSGSSREYMGSCAAVTLFLALGSCWEIFTPEKVKLEGVLSKVCQP